MEQAHPLRGHPLAASSRVYDTVIVGGGPAGLSAALLLGRCGRAVLLCDAGAPRNARARALHGFLSRDGIGPLELLDMGRLELRRYGIEPRAIEAGAQAAVAINRALQERAGLAAR